MREHKYKVWDKTEKCWVANGEPMDLVYSAKVGCFMFDNDNYDLARKDLEFFQFTGLKDKNGVEIYEGDILGGIYEPSYVEHCGVCQQFQLFAKSIPDYGPCQACEGDVHWQELSENTALLEVIGNIHSNPELLKEKS